MAKQSNKVTLESLARMVKHGFDAAASKDGMKTLEAKVDGIDTRLKTVEAKIDKLPTRSEMVDNATLKKQHEAMWKFLHQHFDLHA